MAESLTLNRSWVERIFLRLQGVYGTQFTSKYATGTPVSDDDQRDAGVEIAMAAWGEELAGFAANGEAISYALKYMDAKYPPNAKEFAELCRKAPKAEIPALPSPAADPEKVAAFSSGAKSVTGQKKDFLGWARKPKSAMAFSSLLDLVAKGESHFEEIINDLREAGHVVGNRLVRRWNGFEWTAV